MVYQLDVFDVLADIDADEREAAYTRAEREGMRLNDLLCDECPDPGLCAAQDECQRASR